ncbi:hypothetical protein ACFX15_014226 [Malus domestica]
MGYPNGFNVAQTGCVGGLSMWWDDSLEVEVGFSSKHITGAWIRVVGAKFWARVTWVYESTYQAEKATF